MPLQGCTEEIIYKVGIYLFSGCHSSEASVECLRIDPSNKMFFVWVSTISVVVVVLCSNRYICKWRFTVVYSKNRFTG